MVGAVVLVALLAAERGIAALNLGRNALNAAHAEALVAGATRGGAASAIERLQLDRNRSSCLQPT